jgi:hypothetical protein
MDDMPVDGWWPAEADAPMCQWFRKGSRNISQVVRQSGQRWRAFSMVELNKSGTTGKPLADSVDTRQEAQKQAEEYAATK